MSKRTRKNLCTLGMAWVLPPRRNPLKRGYSLIEPYFLGEASSLAEELVIEAFRLEGRLFRSLRYEVLTDIRHQISLPPEVLAGLFRAEIKSLLPHKRKDFYFICLKETHLACLKKEEDFLFALLLYIFTHELIHMIRFLQFRACFWMHPQQRWKEERKVHSLTQEILKKLELPKMKEVLKSFNEIYEQI